MTTKEVAFRLGVSSYHVRRQIAEGALAATALHGVRSRKIYRIDERDVDAFVARYTGAATDPRFE